MKTIASLSLDLDNQWSYMKTRGNTGWDTFPSYLEVVVPRVLKFLRERDLKITFFIVGQDAALEKNRDAIASIAAAGHEIGNHSFNHEPWLHLYSKAELIEEFEKTEAAIESITGRPMKGFRGPGYSLSPTVLEVLAERGYEYDCTTLPTYIAPLARAYYFFKSPEMNDEEREKRKQLFGKFSDGFRSLKPYSWQVGDRTLIEIPVTTLPILKTPIHASYLLYLSSFSPSAASLYWRTALGLCRFTNTEPSILLHPLDFLSADDVPELRFFPAMDLPIDEKLARVSGIVDELRSNFSVKTLLEHSRLLVDRSVKVSNYEKQPA
jgi:peptidoglycan-N-acetylglucosamine deacetylase